MVTTALPTKASSKIDKWRTSTGTGTTSVQSTALVKLQGLGNPAKEVPTDRPHDSYREDTVIETGIAPSNHFQSQDWNKKENLSTIRVLKGLNQTDLVPAISKFFLTGVDAPRSEKYQIIDTFGDWYIFFYGEQPAIYTFHGVLLNMLDHPWLNEFDFQYDAFMRGTMATRHTTRAFITYGFQQVQGHILNFNHSLRADNDKAANFSIQMAVVKRYALSTDDGNRISDSFIYNKTMLAAFQKLIKDGQGTQYPYSMLRNIMDNNIEPSGPFASQIKSEQAQLAANIAKIGLNPYPNARNV